MTREASATRQLIIHLIVMLGRMVRISQFHGFRRRLLNRLLIATRVFHVTVSGRFPLKATNLDGQLYSSDGDARLTLWYRILPLSSSSTLRTAAILGILVYSNFARPLTIFWLTIFVSHRTSEARKLLVDSHRSFGPLMGAVTPISSCRSRRQRAPHRSS